MFGVVVGVSVQMFLISADSVRSDKEYAPT